MLTDKDYCNYETCVALAELGITYCGLHFYVVGDKDILCSNILQPMTTRTAEVLNYVLAIPLYVAQKFLREERKIEIVVLGEKEIGGPYYADIYTESGYAGYIHKPCEKYEEALSEGVRASIKILQDEQKENN